MIPIQDVVAGTSCRIVSIRGEDASTQRIRELGLVSGTSCVVIRQSLWGGPIEICVGSTRLGVRTAYGLEIYVDLLEDAVTVKVG